LGGISTPARVGHGLGSRFGACRIVPDSRLGETGSVGDAPGVLGGTSRLRRQPRLLARTRLSGSASIGFDLAGADLLRRPTRRLGLARLQLGELALLVSLRFGGLASRLGSLARL
jgi:hypothetical protein